MKILVIDVETTGLDPETDQIIELCIQEGLVSRTQQVWRFYPKVAISQGAKEVHGISLADLSEEPPFAFKADEIYIKLQEADVIVGYNLEFDLAMLRREYERLDRTLVIGAFQVDPYKIWVNQEPRDLKGAYERFAGAYPEGLHTAQEDCIATAEVLKGMLYELDLAALGWEELESLSYPDRANYIGPTDHIQWANDIPIFSFGKFKDKPIWIATTSYLHWVMSTNMPVHVRQICDRLLQFGREGLVEWLKENYGRQ